MQSLSMQLSSLTLKRGAGGYGERVPGNKPVVWAVEDGGELVGGGLGADALACMKL